MNEGPWALLILLAEETAIPAWLSPFSRLLVTSNQTKPTACFYFRHNFLKQHWECSFRSGVPPSSANKWPSFQVASMPVCLLCKCQEHAQGQDRGPHIHITMHVHQPIHHRAKFKREIHFPYFSPLAAVGCDLLATVSQLTAAADTNHRMQQIIWEASLLFMNY